VIRQLLAASYIDQVAVRKDLIDASGPSYARSSSTRGVAYRAVGLSEDVFIHHSSVLFHGPPPEFVIFHELQGSSKIWIKGARQNNSPLLRSARYKNWVLTRAICLGVTKINAAWLSTFGKPLCTFSKVLETPGAEGKKGKLKSTATERECYVVPKFGGPMLDIELPPVKALQKRVGSRWVFV
jgi:ATP-dependent RNA helicase DHX37/DHR1